MPRVIFGIRIRLTRANLAIITALLSSTDVRRLDLERHEAKEAEYSLGEYNMWTQGNLVDTNNFHYIYIKMISTGEEETVTFIPPRKEEIIVFKQWLREKGFEAEYHSWLVEGF